MITQELQEVLRNIPLAHFRPASLNSIKGYTFERFVKDFTAGITVAIVALPLALAPAIASGMTPQSGLYTAIVAGFLISLFGGCRSLIGGPASAFIIVVYGIILQFGVNGMLIATLLSGIILFLMGLFKLGTVVRLVPVSVLIGFTNGIAVLIGLSQVKDFLGLDIGKLPGDSWGQIVMLTEGLPTINWLTAIIGVFSCIVVFGWPKRCPKDAPRWRQWMTKIPGTIVALVITTVAVSVGNLPVETIGTKFGGIPEALPEIVIPHVTWTEVLHLINPAITLAVLAAIETLLCARVADSLTGERHNPNQELMGQGIANFVVPFIGGLPSAGTVARTVTNIKSGSTSSVSGLIHSLVLLFILLFAAPLASDIPITALSAILFYAAYSMGNWHEFVRFKRFSWPYRITFLLTFVLTIVFDLRVAVEIGICVAAVGFLYRMNSLTRVLPIHIKGEDEKSIEAWKIEGVMFFGSILKIENVTDIEHIARKDSPKVVIFDLKHLFSIDMSALDSIQTFYLNLKKYHKMLVICGATGHVLQQIQRLQLDKALGPYFCPTFEDALREAKQFINPKTLPNKEVKKGKSVK